MYSSERNTLPNIDWNNEDHASSLTAHKLRLYLKQHNLRVSGGKATLVARVLRYIQDAQQILEPEDNDATPVTLELQSSDSEDPDDSRRYTIQTLMSNALQCKASRIQVYFLYFSVGGG